MRELPFKQVHIDFHTSPYIPDIGRDFDPEEFSETLKNAHVEMVTCFAKCHHGMCYYPTKVGTMHPSLKFDLLGEMMKACHKAGIKTPVYISSGWDEDAAERHPEWQQLGCNGILGNKTPFETGYYRWRHMCHNNKEYVDHIIAQTGEVLDNYPVDGMYYDIVFQIGCVCNACRKSMMEMGLDPRLPDDVKKHDFIIIKKFMERVSGFIRSKRPGIEIGFNTSYSPDIGYTGTYNVKEKIRFNTCLAIESLASGQWGYNHFPLNVNYHNAYDYEVFGGTGKFHKSWGDFGSLKNLEALQYECFRMIANGAKCNIGDQLHPSGKIDAAVYKRIGEVYKSVREKEPWCSGTKKVVEIGIITSNKDLEENYTSDEGAMRIMLELKQPFDILDSDADLNPYRLVILPDFVHINDKMGERINRYLKNGGKLILSNQSGLNLNLDAFAIDGMGVKYLGEAPYTPDYVRLEESFRGNIEPLDYCFYQKGVEVEALHGSEVLARIVKPYFNRTYDRFCSHCQVPPEKVTDSPAIVRRGNVIYIARPIFKEYITSGTKVYRQIVERCLTILMPDPLFKSDLPVSAEITLRKQENRVILHILNYIPQRKCRELDIVEEVIPLYNRTVKVRLPERPGKVYLAPSGKELDFRFADGYVTTVIPEIQGHEMVVFE